MFLKSPSRSSFKPYFVNFWHVCIIFIGSAYIDTEIFPWVWFQICQWSVSKQDIHIFFPRRLVEGLGEGDSFCDCTCCNKYINWIQVISPGLTFLMDWWRYILNITEDFSFGWVYIFIKTTEYFSFGWGYRFVSITWEFFFGLGL